ADARRYIRATQRKYDVIIADLFHPSRDGSGSLYTLEHFLAVRERLAPGGLFCQWLPLYQLDTEMTKVIIRTFLETFPYVRAYYQPHSDISTLPLALVGTLQPVTYPHDWFRQRVREPSLLRALADVNLSDEVILFGALAAGREELAAFAGAGPLNTDDRPRITFEAPRYTYEKRRPLRVSFQAVVETLRSQVTLPEALLDAFHPHPSEVVAVDGSQAAQDFAQRLTRYLAARNLFLSGGILDLNGQKTKARDAYLASAQTSHDFLSGYAMLLEHARHQADSDPAGAREILLKLESANPSRLEARALLNTLRLEK
ncbi:MAG: spermidine synthase, partial [Candidatus Poribacteria bacterium]|nr:spermidine synthase [Candidatus Poribacteria bacterium]